MLGTALLTALLGATAPALAADHELQIDGFIVNGEGAVGADATGLGYGFGLRYAAPIELQPKKPWWMAVPDIGLSYKSFPGGYHPATLSVGGAIVAGVSHSKAPPKQGGKGKRKHQRGPRGRDKFETMVDLGPELHLGASNFTGFGVSDVHFGGDVGLVLDFDMRKYGIGLQVDQSIYLGNKQDSGLSTWTDIGLHFAFKF